MPIRVLWYLVTAVAIAACSTATATAQPGAPPPAAVVAPADAGVDQVVAADHAPAAAPTIAPASSAPKFEAPDPVEDPAGSWNAIREAKRLGLWVAIALGLLIVSGAYRARMTPKPGEEEPDPSTWSARSLAAASALVAICGPLVEVGLGTGGWGPVITGAVYAIALLRTAINPPKGSAKRTPAAAGV